jgi:hypothetical protein
MGVLEENVGGQDEMFISKTHHCRIVSNAYLQSRISFAPLPYEFDQLSLPEFAKPHRKMILVY